MKQEALQMRRDCAAHHKYEILRLKRLAVGEYPPRTLKAITLAPLI